MKSLPTRASVVLLCAVFGLCLYRAATQSFTIDESFTFLHYVDAPLRDTFGEYSANNHVLFSLVSRIFRYRFGRSEIILRIPTLIGCLLFLSASYWMMRRAVGSGWLLPVGLAAMTLNPLVLDFLVAARGYGLALGLFWGALYLLWTEKFWATGVLAGLSIAANLIFLIPLAALGTVSLLLTYKRGRTWDLLCSYGLTAVLICFVILVIPLSKSAGQFYYGATTLTDTVDNMVSESLPERLRAVGRTAVPVGFILAMAAGAWLIFRESQAVESRESTLLALTLGCMGVSVLCWIAMHRWLGMVYPLNRTALYMLPLAGLAIALAASLAPRRAASFFFTTVAAALAILYSAQLRVRYFNEWRHEAGMSQLVRTLGRDASQAGKSRAVTAGGTWILEYSVRYYSKRHRLGWLKVLDAKERESMEPDYYFLTADEARGRQLKVIDTDAVSGTVLARRK